MMTSHIIAFQQQSCFIAVRSSLSFCDQTRYNGSIAKKKTRDIYRSTSLYMGKIRNKQAELQRKMIIAKQQAAEKENKGDAKQKRMTDEEMKEINDRKRFEELLNSHSASIGAVGERESENYLSQQQEEENIDAYRKFLIKFSIYESS